LEKPQDLRLGDLVLVEDSFDLRPDTLCRLELRLPQRRIWWIIGEGETDREG
jgi:hypothetical protein